MNAFRDPVVEADLDAYVDDQLAAARRIEVEAYLSTRPEEAARVMADLRLRDELRLAAAPPPIAASPATAAAARRLQRGLSRGLLPSSKRRVREVRRRDVGHPPRAFRQRGREGELRVPLFPRCLLPLFNLGGVPIKLRGARAFIFLVEPLRPRVRLCGNQPVS